MIEVLLLALMLPRQAIVSETFNVGAGCSSMPQGRSTPGRKCASIGDLDPRVTKPGRFRERVRDTLERRVEQIGRPTVLVDKPELRA